MTARRTMSMRGRFPALCVVPMMLVMSVAAAPQPQGNPDAAKVTNPVAATPESVAAGKAIYNRRCRGCHAEDGTGGPPKEQNEAVASNLVDAEWDHGATDGEIFHTIRNGVPPQFVMEPWDDRLSETDTWNVVNYLRSLPAQIEPK
jgi:mono/diheme cytochrome c family protein